MLSTDPPSRARYDRRDHYDHYDVIVLGVGGMGAAALRHLAARGVSVLGLEQDVVPSVFGSSTGETRIIRKAYFEDPRYVPLVQRAYVLWRELEAEAGETLLHLTGCLNLGPPDHPAIRGVMESVARHQLPHARLDEAEIQARFPAFRPRGGDVGVFEDDGGYLRVEAATSAHLRRALALGAEVRTKATVVAVETNAVGVVVTLDDGARFTADRLVLTAGPWLGSHPALRELASDLPLVVERQVQLWFRPTEPSIARAPSFPGFIHFLPDRAFYGLPMAMTAGSEQVEPAVKICRHHGGEPTTVDGLDRSIRVEDEAVVRAYVRAHVPIADGPLLRSRVCMYTNTPDENFLLGVHPRAPRVIVAGGFSGHGYKFASAIGEVIADLATRGQSEHDLSMFSPGRFC